MMASRLSMFVGSCGTEGGNKGKTSSLIACRNSSAAGLAAGWGAMSDGTTCLLSLPVGFQNAVEFEVFKLIPFPDMLDSAALMRQPQFQHDTTRRWIATDMA
jgi:hypothetical protein